MSNVEATKKAYAAFSAGDLETVLSILDDDTEWFLPGHHPRRIRTPSRCVQLPRRQNRQSPELRGHCHAGTDLRHEVVEAPEPRAGTSTGGPGVRRAWSFGCRTRPPVSRLGRESDDATA